jgi:hypothetical protein
MEAIERYDGPSWRIVRSTLRERPAIRERLIIWALSAEFGLIPASHPIPSYNRTLDLQRATALAPLITTQFAELARPHVAEGFGHALLCVSKGYLAALAPIEPPLAALCRTPVAVTTRS